jgi:hypothetical protein
VPTVLVLYGAGGVLGKSEVFHDASLAPSVGGKGVVVSEAIGAVVVVGTAVRAGDFKVVAELGSRGKACATGSASAARACFSTRAARTPGALVAVTP